MSISNYQGYLKNFFRDIEKNNITPEEWYINSFFPRQSDEFIKLVICYVFFHHEKGIKTKVHKQYILDIIKSKNLKLEI